MALTSAPSLTVPSEEGTDRLDATFFSGYSCEELSIALLGCRLHRRLPDNDEELVGEIVETEAYLGVGLDRASHSFSGKETLRNAAMFMAPGTVYVYTIYGMHLCVNISSVGPGAAVLLRALKPLKGVEEMRKRRKLAGKAEKKETGRKRKNSESLTPVLKAKDAAVIAASFPTNTKTTTTSTSNASPFVSASSATAKVTPLTMETKAATSSKTSETLKDLCDGPAKLCQALNITKSFDQKNLSTLADFYLSAAPSSDEGRVDVVVRSPRIGIGKAAGTEAVNRPLRFYRLCDSAFVSKRDKKAEGVAINSR